MRFNRRSVKVTTPPALLAVTVDEMKEFLRIDGSDDNNLLELFIKSAIDAGEQYCRCSFITQTLELTMDGFVTDSDEAMARLGSGVFNVPRSSFVFGTGEIDLPSGPVQSVTSVKTFNVENMETTFSDDNYIVEVDRIVLNQNSMWPTNLRERAAVKVVFVAGYGDNANDIPPAIRQAIRSHVGQMYECRGVCDMSDACKRLYDGYKRYDELGFL